MEDPTSNVMKLKQSLYGLKQAAYDVIPIRNYEGQCFAAALVYNSGGLLFEYIFINHQDGE